MATGRIGIDAEQIGGQWPSDQQPAQRFADESQLHDRSESIIVIGSFVIGGQQPAHVHVQHHDEDKTVRPDLSKGSSQC